MVALCGAAVAAGSVQPGVVAASGHMPADDSS